jgi:glycosyltransferase involved in cell wall biosynthesis
MSVYNGEKYLREAIESILNQTFTDFEFIIIDDGSTDESAAIINSYNDARIRLIQQENKGLASALNVGLKTARGKYIARMDADDVSLPERLEAQFWFLEHHAECVVVGSEALVIDMNGEYLYTFRHPSTWEEIRNVLPKCPFFHSATMFRKQVAMQYGGYYEEIRHHFEDMILWNRMAQLGELRNIERPLIKYRLVPSAISNRSDETVVIMGGICENILVNGRISHEDLKLLESITQKRSERWKKSNYYLRIGKAYIERNLQRGNAVINLAKSILNYPANGKAWFNLALLLLPKVFIKKWKRHRGVF